MFDARYASHSPLAIRRVADAGVLISKTAVRESTQLGSMIVVLNWFEELRAVQDVRLKLAETSLPVQVAQR